MPHAAGLSHLVVHRKRATCGEIAFGCFIQIVYKKQAACDRNTLKFTQMKDQLKEGFGGLPISEWILTLARHML